MSRAHAKYLITNMLAGLAFLHSKKVIHRDLKSQNIFLGEGGTPKLGDFGVAKRLNTAQPMAMSVVGTPLYLSPELCNGEAYDFATDIWAVGCLAYEICTGGRLPFSASNHGAVIKRIIMGEYSRLPSHHGRVMCGVVDLCLSQRPEERPSAQEVIVRLEGVTGDNEEVQSDTSPCTPPQTSCRA